LTLCFCRAHFKIVAIQVAKNWHSHYSRMVAMNKADEESSSEESAEAPLQDVGSMSQAFGKLFDDVIDMVNGTLETANSTLAEVEKLPDVEKTKEELIQMDILPVIVDSQIETSQSVSGYLFQAAMECDVRKVGVYLKHKTSKFFRGLWIRTQSIDADEVVAWLFAMAATGVVSYGVSRACDKAFASKPKYTFEEEKVRAKHKFWAIYGDSNGKYRQYDEITLLDDRGKASGKMSWGDFKQFFNTPRGQQQLMDHYADKNGEVHFAVKGREQTGKIKMRNLNYVYEAAVKRPDYDFSKLDVQTKDLEKWRKKRSEDLDAKKKKIFATLDRVETMRVERQICSTCGKTHRGKCLGKNVRKAETCVVEHEGQLVHPLKVLEEIYKEERILNGIQMINLDDVHNRVGKVFVDNEFTLNCYLHGNKVVVLTHGVRESGRVVENKRIQFVFPDETLLPIGEIKTLGNNDDFSYFLVQPAKAKQRIALREPKLGERVCLIAYKSGDDALPSISDGVVGRNGEHTCSSVEGCCSGIFLSREDKQIVGFHCAGGSLVNRGWMVNDAIKKHLNC